MRQQQKNIIMQVIYRPKKEKAKPSTNREANKKKKKTSKIRRKA